MNVSITQWGINEAEGDLCGVFVLQGGPADVHPLVQQAFESGDCDGSYGTSLVLPAYKTFKAKRLCIVGLGKPEELTTDRVRRATASIIFKAKDLKLRTVTIVVPELSLADTALVSAIAEGALLTDYSYSKHTDPTHQKQQHVTTLHLAVGGRSVAPMQDAVRRVQTVYAGVRLCRDLVNEGSEMVNTLHMEQVARELAAKHRLKITVLDDNELLKQKLNLLHAVGRAGSTPPRLIVIEYIGNPDSDERIALIGKTICFDTGGVNIKPWEGMETMRQDMAGGATVLGTLDAACTLSLPLNIVAVLAVAENGVGPQAFRPGEVITSHSGKTVEIKHTDAEGRLVLADAISYTKKHYDPKAIIDVATLTGAAVVALGTHIIPTVGNDTALSGRLFDAGQRVHERVWMLPLYDEYRDEIKSDIADIKNLGEGRNAGTIAGAAFLDAFVGGTPWAHLDIAGVAFYDKARGYLPQGATGVGVRLLVETLSAWDGGVVETTGEKKVLQH